MLYECYKNKGNKMRNEEIIKVDPARVHAAMLYNIYCDPLTTLFDLIIHDSKSNSRKPLGLSKTVSGSNIYINEILSAFLAIAKGKTGLYDTTRHKFSPVDLLRKRIVDEEKNFIEVVQHYGQFFPKFTLSSLKELPGETSKLIECYTPPPIEKDDSTTANMHSFEKFLGFYTENRKEYGSFAKNTVIGYAWNFFTATDLSKDIASGKVFTLAQVYRFLDTHEDKQATQTLKQLGIVLPRPPSQECVFLLLNKLKFLGGIKDLINIVVGYLNIDYITISTHDEKPTLPLFSSIETIISSLDQHDLFTIKILSQLVMEFLKPDIHDSLYVDEQSLTSIQNFRMDL